MSDSRQKRDRDEGDAPAAPVEKPRSKFGGGSSGFDSSVRAPPQKVVVEAPPTAAVDAAPTTTEKPRSKFGGGSSGLAARPTSQAPTQQAPAPVVTATPAEAIAAAKPRSRFGGGSSGLPAQPVAQPATSTSSYQQPPAGSIADQGAATEAPADTNKPRSKFGGGSSGLPSKPAGGGSQYVAIPKAAAVAPREPTGMFAPTPTPTVPAAGSIAAQAQGAAQAADYSAPAVAGSVAPLGDADEGSAPRKAGAPNMFHKMDKNARKKEYYKKKGEKEKARVLTQIADGHRLNPKPVADGDEKEEGGDEQTNNASNCIFDRAYGWHCVWQQLWKDCPRPTDNQDEEGQQQLESSYTFNDGQIAKACVKSGNYVPGKFMTWCNRFFHKNCRYNRVFNIVNTTLEFHTQTGMWSWVEVEWATLLETIYKAFQDEETGELLPAVSIKNLRSKTGLDLQDEHFVTGCLCTIGRKQDNIPTHHNMCLGVDEDDRSTRSLRAFLKAHSEDKRMPHGKSVWVSRPAVIPANPAATASNKVKKGVQQKDIKKKEEDNEEEDAVPGKKVPGGGGKERGLVRLVTKIFKEMSVTPGGQLYWNPPTIAPKDAADAKKQAKEEKYLSFLKQLGLTKEDFGMSPIFGQLNPWFRLTGSVLVLVEQPASGKLQYRQQEDLLACVNQASSAKKKKTAPADANENMFTDADGYPVYVDPTSNATLAFQTRKKKITTSLQERARGEGLTKKTEPKKNLGVKEPKKKRVNLHKKGSNKNAERRKKMKAEGLL